LASAELVLFVPDVVPVQQGSKLFGVTKDGRAYGREAAGGKLYSYRKAVAASALEQLQGRPKPLFDQGTPVQVSMVFLYKQLKSAPGRVWKTSSPDVDKLARAAGDALSGIAYYDDAQVADLRATKRHARIEERPGVHILVKQLREEDLN